MKHISLIALFLLPAASSLFAQGGTSDRWKETQRLDLKKKQVSYTDTLRLSDVSKEGMSIRKGAFQYKGTISNDLLDFGYQTFGIVKNNKEEIQLRDEEFFHVFTREAKDMSAADAAQKKEAIELPAKPVDNISLPLLSGTWEVYKRKGRNGPLPKVDYKTLIMGLTISQQNAAGSIGYFSGGQGQGPLYLVREAKGSDIIATDTDKKEHRIKVWRLTAEELVIEDESSIIYYLKHFR